MIVDSHVLDAQYGLPHFCDRSLGVIARCNELPAGPRRFRRGQCATIQFAVGGERERVEKEEMRGEHVVRQGAAQLVAELLEERGRRRIADEIGREPFWPG